MKKTLFLFVALLAVTAISAQGKKPAYRSMMSFHGGISYPIGDFGNDDVLDQGSGLTKMGGVFKIDYAYFVEKNFGVAANFMISSNRTIPEAYENLLVASEGDSYQMFGFLAGPAFSKDFTSKLIGEFRMMGGLVNVKTPRSSHKNLPVLKDNQWTGALQATGQLRYHFSKRGFLLLNADYIHLNPKFKLNGPANPDPPTFKQDISVLNGTFGAGFYF